MLRKSQRTIIVDLEYKIGIFKYAVIGDCQMLIINATSYLSRLENREMFACGIIVNNLLKHLL